MWTKSKMYRMDQKREIHTEWSAVSKQVYDTYSVVQECKSKCVMAYVGHMLYIVSLYVYFISFSLHYFCRYIFVSEFFSSREVATYSYYKNVEQFTRNVIHLQPRDKCCIKHSIL